MSGFTELVSVYAPPMNPTPRSTWPATSTLLTKRGKAGSPGFEATPSGPDTYVVPGTRVDGLTAVPDVLTLMSSNGTPVPVFSGSTIDPPAPDISRVPVMLI